MRGEEDGKPRSQDRWSIDIKFLRQLFIIEMDPCRWTEGLRLTEVGMVDDSK